MTSRRERARLVVVVLSTVLGPCAAAMPARAQTGGVTIPQPVAPTTGGTGYGEAGTRAIRVAPTALRNQIVYVRGTLPGARRRRVILQRLDAQGAWRNERRGRVRSNERFRISWRAHVSGRQSLRVVLARGGSGSRTRTAPVAKISVYRRAKATYFGPGLYGRKTACGQTLTPALVGVAHKTLKCGTLVALFYKRREILAPVVDRGPFNGDYALDLTAAAAQLLAFTASGEIGYLRLPTRAP
jgi:peptidoglycan lytic transglycosylase